MIMTAKSSKTAKLFQDQLVAYKKLIDEDIAGYSKKIKDSTEIQYGHYAALATEAYLDILKRGGKRIRGALVMAGYEMCGGKDKKMILQAARAIEMLHAYILILDDIQDRSPARRGGPSAHQKLADYHQKHELQGNSLHFGEALAINGACAGAHAANAILANLNAPEELRLKAISIINRTITVTAHGQTNDLVNEVTNTTNEASIDKVIVWKTAHYTFLNPIHTGMVLAGAECDSTDAITPYALNTGRAYQITDDILGIFGKQSEMGKDPMDDIREGKRTILTIYALKNSRKQDTEFLKRMLGNEDITPTEFEICKKIIADSGALDYAQKKVDFQIKQALAALDKAKVNWPKKSIDFLKGMAESIQGRHA